MKKTNSALSLLSATILALSAFSGLTAKAGNDGFELQSVTFNFETVKNPRTGKEAIVSPDWDGPIFFGDNGFAGVSSVRDRIIKGTLVIDEYDDHQMVARKTSIPNVYLALRAKGLTAGAKATWNHSLTIHGMEGKTVEELLNTPFSGFKFSAGAGLAVGVNPNMEYLSSKNGLSIVDLESLLAATGAGIQVLSMKAMFKTEVAPTQLIEVTSTDKAGSVTSTTSLETLKSRKL